MSVGNRIAKLREELGLSQTELANMAGLKPPTISQYESGVRNPSYEALVKLSNALNISTDFLISGKQVASDSITDQTVKLLLRVIEKMPPEDKQLLFDYAIFLTQKGRANEYSQPKTPLLNSAKEYARYLFDNMGLNIPVNLTKIASSYGIRIEETELPIDGEGMLINGNERLILIDSSIKNKQRRIFTTAMLLGLAIIPWHVNQQYVVRKKGTSSLLSENIEEIEAQEFAAALLVPEKTFKDDILQNELSINALKELALNKYNVSLFTLCNRLVEIAGQTYAVVQSKDNKIKETFPGKRPLKDQLDPRSIAVSFFSTPPTEEEIRTGNLPLEYWFQDGKANEFVYEESIYNPEYESVLTLLKIVTING